MSDAPTPARRPVEERPLRIVSARPSFGQRLAAIWNARELLTHFIATDIKIKYKSSALGMIWSLVSPALTLAIYYLVFGLIIKNPIPHFAIFLFSGLLVWNFFSNVVLTSTGIVVDRAAVVKKVSFPREILALSTVGTSFIYFAMQLSIMVLFLAISHHAPDWGTLWLLPIALLALALLAGALGIFLSAVNVHLRDTKHLIEVGMQLWFFLTPIIYSFENQVSPRLHGHNILGIYFLNPITPIVMTFQRVLYRSEIAVVVSKVPHPHATYLKVLPTWPTTTYVLLDGVLVLIGAIALALSIIVFGRLEGAFAEEL